jgi:hypothetical protein
MIRSIDYVAKDSGVLVLTRTRQKASNKKIYFIGWLKNSMAKELHCKKLPAN